MDIIHWWMNWPAWLQDVSVIILVLALLNPRVVIHKR